MFDAVEIIGDVRPICPWAYTGSGYSAGLPSPPMP